MEKGKFILSGTGMISVDAMGTIRINGEILEDKIMDHFGFDSLEAGGEVEKVFPGRVFLMISKEPLLVENTMEDDRHG